MCVVPVSPAPLVEYRRRVEKHMRSGRWQAGLEIYEECETELGAVMPPGWHASLVSVAVAGLCRAGQVQRASGFLLSRLAGEGGASLGPLLEPVPRDRLLDACASTPGQMRAARDIVTLLAAANATLSAKTYCILIKGFGRTGDARSVAATLAEMRASGVPPDLITCNAAIDAYARAGAVSQAEALLRSMEGTAQKEHALDAAGAAADVTLLPKPNGRTYNTMLKAYALAGDLENAESLAARMRGDAGADLLPTAAGAGEQGRATAATCFDEISLNTLVNAYARAGRLDSALALLHSASSLPRGEGPDGTATPLRAGAHAYTSVITALADARRLPDALLLFQGMRAAGLKPTVVTYNALIAACVRCGDVVRAVRLMDAICAQDSPVRPDEQTFNTLIVAFCRIADSAPASGSVSERARAAAAKEGSMMVNGGNAAAWASVAPDGPWEQVLSLLKEMDDRGLKRTVRTYNALLGALARRGDALAADAVERRMAAEGVAPTVHTYTALMRARGLAGDLAGVRQAFRTLKESSLQVDRAAVHEFMSACLTCDARVARAAGSRAVGAPGAPARLGPGSSAALAALQSMRAPPVTLDPDVVTYSVLFAGLGRTSAGAHQAWTLYKRMKREGIRLDVPCARALMIVCKRHLGYGKAAELFEHLRDAGWPDASLAPFERELQSLELTWSRTVDEQWKQEDGSRRRRPRGRDRLFEKHGWNEFDNGFRVL